MSPFNRISIMALVISISLIVAGCSQNNSDLSEQWADIDLALVTMDGSGGSSIIGVDVDSAVIHKIADVSSLVEGPISQTSEVSVPDSTENITLALPAADGSQTDIININPSEQTVEAVSSLKDFAFPIAGQTWAAALTGNGETLGEVRFGSRFGSFDDVANIRFSL